MTHLNRVLCLLIISTSQLIYHAVAMNPESIYGGFPARIGQFTYHVAIVAENSLDSTVNLVCSGSFISGNLVLTAARCFVYNNGQFKVSQYSIITDTINWKHLKGTQVMVDLIYLPAGGNYYLNDIAVAKLHADFNLANHPRLSALDIPNATESFNGSTGTVAGCGYMAPLTIFNSSHFRTAFSAITEFLQFAHVLITNQIFCVPFNRSINPSKQFCGVMISEIPGQSWGICERDAGSPLVFQNKIVGVAGLNHKNCNDTVNGVAYTKVSEYAAFINSIIGGNPLPGTLVHKNLGLLHQLVAPAA